MSGAGTVLSACDSGPRKIGRKLQAGSAWRLEDTVEGTLDYRGPGALAGPTIELVTIGDRSSARARLDRVAPVDLRGQILRFWLRIEEHSARQLHQINVKVGSGQWAFSDSTFQSIVIPAPGGDYGTEYLKPGEWLGVTVVPASLASGAIGATDFRAARDFAVEIVDRGHGPARVLLGGMDVIPADPAFPKGAVSLTFDDGVASHYSLMAPILARHGYTGTAYVIRDLVGQAGYMTLAQLRDLDRRGWEIALHAEHVAAHNARGGFTSLSSAGIVSEWRDEAAWLRANGFSGSRDSAYPQGIFDARVLAAAKRYGKLDTARTTSFRSVETLPVSDPLRLRTISYDATVTISPGSRLGTIKWRIDQVREYGGWLILCFHDDTSATSDGSAISAGHLREIVDYVARRDIPVMPVGEVWRRSSRVAVGAPPP